MEEEKEGKGFSYALLHEGVKAEKKHKLYDVCVKGGFLYFNMRVIPNRFRYVSDEAPAVGEPHVESNVISHAGDYVRYRRTDGAEGGYKIFGLTREKAYELITNSNLNDVVFLLQPAIKEALTSIEFLNYLHQNLYVELDVTLKQIEENINEYLSNIEIIKAYINYDVKDAKVDEGWPHRAVLKTLAYITDIELQTWRFNDMGALILEKEKGRTRKKHVKESMKDHKQKRKKRINVFFLENNHFDQIEFLNVGWKIHISLAEDGDNIERAWNLIVDLLQVYGVRNCKVLEAGKHLPVYQWGKEITLYVPHEVLHWQALLDEITKRFVENGIRPNCLAFKDKAVDGSSYFGFRNDESAEGRYVNGYEAKDFNPSEQPVPPQIKSLKILCEDQEPRKLRNNELLLEAFYRKLHSAYREAAGAILSRLIDCWPKFAKTNPSSPIWNLGQAELEAFFSTFDEEFRIAIINEIEKIKEVQQLEFIDFAHLSEHQLFVAEEKYNQRLAEVSSIIDRIVSAISEQLMEAYAKGTPSNSSSSEGSPRNEDNQGGATPVHPQGK